MVNMPAPGPNQINDLLLDLATELSIVDINVMADAVNDAFSLIRALEKVLRKNIIIVIDEFQNALDVLGRPIEGLVDALERISNRPHFPGRLLLPSGTSACRRCP